MPLKPGLGHQKAGLLISLGAAERLLHQRAEGDVLEIGLPREQGAVLEHDHAIGANLCLRSAGAAEQLAVEIDGAAVETVKAGDGIKQRGLAAAGRTNDHANFAGCDIEGAMIDGEDARPVRIVEFDGIVDLERAARCDVFGREPHAWPSMASWRARQCIAQSPAARTSALVAYPTMPRVSMAMTIVGYWTVV